MRSGQVSAAELVEAAIARIEARNPALNAVITPTFERARRDAATMGAGSGAPGSDAPFAGVPFLMKDLGAHLAGERYCAGMAVLRDLDYRPDFDTEVATRFRAAGLISLGKTNTPEWGSLPTTEPLAFGPTSNPWSPAHSPGGSSGGSAAAVAAGMVALASGGDGGGSIRVPASACGIFGLKPSRGRVPTGPHHGEVWGGFATEGVLSRSVRDSAVALDVLAQHLAGATFGGDPYLAPPPSRPYRQEVGADPGRLRIGVMTDAPGELCEVHPDCRRAVRQAAELFASLGHHIEVDDRESLPEALRDHDQAAEMRRHFGIIVSAHSAQEFDAWERVVGRPLQLGDIEPVDWAMVQRARTRPTGRYLTAVEWIDGWRRRLCGWWSGHDLLLTPTMACPPLLLGQLDHTDENPLAGMAAAHPAIAFTAPFNASGQPAMSVPLYRNAAGLPIGVQLVAAPWREDLLFRVAGQLEAAGAFLPLPV